MLGFFFFFCNTNWPWIYEVSPHPLNEIYAYIKGPKTKVTWNNEEIKSSNGKYICMAEMLIHLSWVERMSFPCQMTCHENKMVATLTLYILNKHNSTSPVSVWKSHVYSYHWPLNTAGVRVDDRPFPPQSQKTYVQLLSH